MIGSHQSKLYLSFMLIALLANQIFAQEQIGVAAAVNKNTTDLTPAQERTLINAGYEIIQNHTIETDDIGRAQMLLLDGTAFSVGPNSSVVLDKFIYNPETGDGSLAITAKGLLRIVGGKITKKQPALIRTNSATVGIRGGIGIVQTEGSKTNAIFLYGTEMTVIPNCVDLDTFGDQCSPNFAASVTEPGFLVSVENQDSEPSEPEAVTPESLDSLQSEFEIQEEETIEEESTEEESTEEESTEEESTEEESTEEESTEEESTEEESTEEESTEEESTEEESTEEEITESEDSSEENTTTQEESSEDQAEETPAAEEESNEDTAEEAPVTAEEESAEETTATEEAPAEETASTEEVSTGDTAQTEEAQSDESVPQDSSQVTTESSASSSSDSNDAGVDGGEAQDTDSSEIEVETDISSADASDNVDLDTSSLDTIENNDQPSSPSVALGDLNDVATNEDSPEIDIEGPPTALASEIELSNFDSDESGRVDIDESFLDSLGISEISSSTAPEDLGSADQFEFAIELETVEADDAIENQTESVTEEVATTTQETTLEVAPIFQVDAGESIESISENIVNETIAPLIIINPGDLSYSVLIFGSDAGLVKFDAETSSIILTESLDFESQANLSFTVTIFSENNDISEIDFLLNVDDVDEPIEFNSSFFGESFIESASVPENLPAETVIYEFFASDPEGKEISYTLSGQGSEFFSIDSDGKVAVLNELDYETNQSFELTVIASDGINETATPFEISVFDVPELSLELASSSFTIAESAGTGTTLTRFSSSTDTGATLEYSLSGEGSEYFKVDEFGNITLDDTLDYETAPSYTITLTVSDGINEVKNDIEVFVGDVAELEVELASSSVSINESTDAGTSLISFSAETDSSSSISYSIEGEGSEFFSVDEDGNITLNDSVSYESASSYSLTLVASDGSNTSSNAFEISVSEAIVTIELASTSITLSETVASGTSVTTSSATTNTGKSITYSLSGTGSDKFQVASDGTITTAANLNYQSATSYSLTLTASDGVKTASENLIISITDEDLSFSASLAAESQGETLSTGSSVATSVSLGADASVTYTLTDEDNKFAIDSATGEVTLANALDYETKTSHEFTITATDGTTTKSETFSLTVDDESLSLSASLASNSQSEGLSTGATIATSSSAGADASVTYTLTDEDNKFAIDSSTGAVTLANALDYETKTSHEFTITATDGITTVTETFSLLVTDESLSLSASLASSSQSEGLSTGTTIATSAIEGADASVTYTLTDEDNKFAIDSSTGEVTLANALDYETKTSHEFTITATDGTTTKTETFTLDVTDLTLAFSASIASATQGESLATGATIASSSSTDAEGTVTYTLTDEDNKFAIDSSTGAVTLANALDYETKTSHEFTITATDGTTTSSENFTLSVNNIEELESAVLRYSADYNSASRSGFSATATRGPSGSSLAAYTLEQVGTTNSTAITSVDDTSNNFVPVEINSGTALNWRYYFPIDTSGNGQFAFAPNSSALDGKYYSPLGTAVTTTIANADFLTAGRLESAEYWFMTTDKSAADINFDSALGGYTSITDYSPSWDSSDDLLNDINNTLGGTQIDWSSACSDNINGCYHKSIEIELPSAFTYYDQSITSLWVHSNGYASSQGSRLGTQDYSRSSSAGQKGYALDTLYDNRAWDEGNQPSNISLNGTLLNYSMFPFWTAQKLDSNSRGYYVDQTGTTGLFIIGWYSWELYSSSGISNYEIVLNYNTNEVQFRYGGLPSIDNSYNNRAIGLTGDLSTSGCSWQGTSNNSRTCAGAYEAYLFQDSHFGQQGDEGYGTLAGDGGLSFAPSAGTQGTSASSTYNLFEDQVTLAGEVYTDTHFANFTNSNKRVIAMAVIPIENFAASGSSNDYFIPNFIPKTLWSYGDVGHDYCLGTGNDASACNTYENYYDFSSIALDSSDMLDTSRFNGSTNELPEGQSLWWQVLNPSGVGVGLWAQISLKDSYDGAEGDTTRDDQQSLLNVVISNVDYRNNDTTRYSLGDTGLGMVGYHYWSYQGATNSDNDGLGINYGTSPIECATSSDSGCFWGDNSNQPGGAMITSSDPYKSGSMTLGVNYNSNNDTFSTGSFNVSAVVQDVKPSSSSYADYASLSDFRSADFYTSSASDYSGFFSGILEFDVEGTGNNQLASMRTAVNLATFTFDSTNDDVQVVAPMSVSSVPSNNYTTNWTTVDTGFMTLKFGDATNDEAKSAYISNEVFGAEISNDGSQIDGSDGSANNLAGVIISYNTLDKEDTDLFHTNGNDSMPDAEYATWGFWAMSAADISPETGDQNASVHLGAWVGGELVEQNKIPTTGSASMSGAAVMSVAYRYDQKETNYDVHKYTTTADVAATFNWGASGYSGSIDFSNFDDKNPIVSNAGFTSFSVAINGTGNTYNGVSTDTLENSWLGGAIIAGALYGNADVDESGGMVNVNLYKSGDIETDGANDFYTAEGIYLID